MEAYLDGKQPDAETLKKLIRKGTINGAFVPVLCGSAFKNKGVQPMLDAVVDFLPSPLDVPAVKGLEVDGDTEMTRKADDDEPFSGLAFKIMTDPFVGSLTFVRVYSGVLASSTQVLNTVKGDTRACRPHAADACQSPRRHQGSPRRRHRGAGRPQGHHHRRHAVRSDATRSCWSA